MEVVPAGLWFNLGLSVRTEETDDKALKIIFFTNPAGRMFICW